MGVLHAIGVTAVAKFNTFRSGDITVPAVLAIAVLVGVAATWSAVDSWLARADRGRNWFIAGLIAGPAAGILGVIGRALFVDQTGVGALGEALTGGAAFLALLVIVPAGLGLFVGGRIIRSGGSPDSAEDDPPEPPRRLRRATGRRRRRGTIIARKRASQAATPTPAPRTRS